VEISDTTIQRAEQSMRERLASPPHAIAARYDRRVSRIMVTLSNGLELAFPPHMAEGLADAKPADLAVIEITPTGLGLLGPSWMRTCICRPCWKASSDRLAGWPD